jgi:hypothetical protein
VDCAHVHTCFPERMDPMPDEFRTGSHA